MKDTVDLLREGMGGLRSHAVIPASHTHPRWYKLQAEVMQRAADEIESLRDLLSRLNDELGYEIGCTGLDHEVNAALGSGSSAPPEANHEPGTP